nr:hypothetical protein CFP56_33426 [Quercus suber]
MSHLRYSAYLGHGENASESSHMSQAIRIPPGETITISGQGGWDRSTSKVLSDAEEEMNRAFDNLNHTLIHAGGKGIASVFKLVIYYAPYSDEWLKITVENLKRWFPNHRPVLTAIGIEKLALPGMRVEIDAWAHLVFQVYKAPLTILLHRSAHDPASIMWIHSIIRSCSLYQSLTPALEQEGGLPSRKIILRHLRQEYKPRSLFRHCNGSEMSADVARDAGWQLIAYAKTIGRKAEALLKNQDVAAKCHVIVHFPGAGTRSSESGTLYLSQGEQQETYRILTLAPGQCGKGWTANPTSSLDIVR